MPHQRNLPALTDPVMRTFDVGIRFLSNDRKIRRELEIEANAIIKELQEQAFSRITPQSTTIALQY
jgi:hypothetical protein